MPSEFTRWGQNNRGLEGPRQKEAAYYSFRSIRQPSAFSDPPTNSRYCVREANCSRFSLRRLTSWSWSIRPLSSAINDIDPLAFMSSSRCWRAQIDRLQFGFVLLRFHYSRFSTREEGKTLTYQARFLELFVCWRGLVREEAAQRGQVQGEDPKRATVGGKAGYFEDRSPDGAIEKYFGKWKVAVSVKFMVLCLRSPD